MTDRELNIALREMARAKGLCDEWYEAWSDDSTIDECLDRYMKGYDFAIKNDYPPLDFARKNFRKEDLRRHGIYLDDDVTIDITTSGFYVILGSSKVTVRVSDFAVATIYVRHDSEAKVMAADGARVFVITYENSTARCESDEWSFIKKYARGENK